MRTTIRRALVAITGALLLIAGMVPAQAASDRGEEARSEHQRIVDFWTPARVAQAVPRDPVFDDRGLPYLRAADGSLTPFGHGTPARVQASVPAAATAPEPAAGPSAMDSTGPAISGMVPADGATIGSAHQFRATVVDGPDGVKAVSFVLTRPDGSTQSNSATYLGNDRWGIDYSGFWDGDWEWQVVAKDGARRGGNTATSGPVSFTVDTNSGGSGGGSGGGGGATEPVLGASWTGEGAVQATTGKVLFAIGTSYYVCSASVVRDLGFDNGYSLILTAAHCVYDGGRGGQFATNWMFIPDYDAKAVPLTTSGNFCADTKYGCWTAEAMVIDSGFASERRFTSTATLHDYAVVRVGAGGIGGGVQLDLAVGTQAVSFSPRTLDGDSLPDTHLFGYPAASPYDGKDLVYSFGDLGLDPLNNSLTYRVASDMTGGCSGGPWFQGFTAGVVTQMSVNSYGYQGVTALHGPILNANTAAVYNEAKTATANTIVQVP